MTDAATSHLPATSETRGGSGPTIALALGGGGARGLAHAVILEAFDELGIRPKMIAGTSIGAVFGAAYASGLSAREIRAHTEETLASRLDLLRDLVAARAPGATRFWNVLNASQAILDASATLDLVLPSRVARDFSELVIPLKVVASDFYGLEQVVLREGPLRRAVAASMALPVIFEPVVIDGRAMIDGGLTNPLPFDLLYGEADLVVAIDVSGVPAPSEKRQHPTALEALTASPFLFERTIIREKLKSRQPDIYIEAGTGAYQALEFLKVRDILLAAEPAKARLKQQLARVLEAETLPEISDAGPPLAIEAPTGGWGARQRLSLMQRLRRRPRFRGSSSRGDPQKTS